MLLVNYWVLLGGIVYGMAVAFVVGLTWRA